MDSNSKSVDLMNKEHFNHAPREDILPTVDDDDDLDDEVRLCLVGLPSYKPGADHSSSPDSCSFYSSCTQDDLSSQVDTMSTISFYSSCTQDDLGSQVDTMSTISFYSTGTMRDVDTDTASFCSVETLQEKEDEEEEEELKELEDEQKPKDNFQTCDTSEEIPDLPRDKTPECHKPDVPQSPSGTPSGLSYSRPSYLAGSKMSVTTGSSSSLVSEEELSFAGHVNDRLGKLLGYVGRGAEGVPTQDALASIVGYAIVIK